MLSGQVNVSAAAWIKTASAADQLIVMQRSTASGGGQWQIALSGGKVFAYAQDGSNSGNTVGFFSNSTVDDGVWHHVGFAQNGTDYTLYIDGQPDASSTMSANTPPTFASNVAGSIGYDRRDAILDPSHPRRFDGAIDEVGAWNAGLSGSDFATLYNSGAGDQYPF
jgi:hypothetical protein